MKIDLNIPIFKKINELTEQEKYQCFCSIPGSFLEMRSGYLPTSSKKINKIFLREFREIYSLKDEKKIKKEIKDRENSIYFFESLRMYSNAFPIFLEKMRVITNYIIFIISKIRLTSNMENKSKEKIVTTLKYKDGRTIKVEYPNNIVSLGLIKEIFIDEVYFFDEEVDTIYDFGGNIGLATLYFKLLSPTSKVVTIEPLQKNIEILKKNILLNNLNDVNLIEAGVGKENGISKLYYSIQSEALPSVSIRQKNYETIKLISFKNIVDSLNYGIKIDIEGNESELIYFPEIIKNAKWLVGEIHYSNDFKKNKKIDKFIEILMENFEIFLGKPIIYFVADEITLCRSFKTTFKKINSCSSLRNASPY